MRLSIDPRDPDALFTKAAFLAKRGNAETALILLNRVAEADAEYPGVWRLLACLHSELGDKHLAELCLARAAMSG